MRLFIDHRTDYSFSQPQTRLVQLLRLTPMSHVGQSVVDWQIDVDCDARLKSGRDGYGNETTMLYVDGPIERIGITVSGEVLTDDRAGIVTGALEPLPPLLFTRSTPLTKASPEIAAFAQEATAGSESALSAMHALMRAIHERVAFEVGGGDVGRTAARAFEEGHGVCQDHAHVMIAAARTLGLPARYVSGYLWRPDEAVSRAAHAWAEVSVPDYGWIGFDPANDHCPDDSYVRVAAGLDYREAAPLSGARTGGGGEWLEVSVQVRRQRAGGTPAQSQSQSQN